MSDILEHVGVVPRIELHHVDRIQDDFKIREGSLILKMISW